MDEPADLLDFLLAPCKPRTARTLLVQAGERRVSLELAAPVAHQCLAEHVHAVNPS